MGSAFFDPFPCTVPTKTEVTALGKVSGWQQGQQRWPMARSTGGFYPEMASPGLRLGPPTLFSVTAQLHSQLVMKLN